MSDEHATCGSTDTQDGTPCERPAAWGTDRDIGPCKEHATEGKVYRKLTEEVKQSIIGAARHGAKYKHQAMVAGISPRRWREWRAEAEELLDSGVENDLTEFYRRFQRARGAGAVERLRDSNDEWVLERSFGYTKTEKRELEHNTSEEGPLMVIRDGGD